MPSFYELGRKFAAEGLNIEYMYQGDGVSPPPTPVPVVDLGRFPGARASLRKRQLRKLLKEQLGPMNTTGVPSDVLPPPRFQGLD